MRKLLLTVIFVVCFGVFAFAQEAKLPRTGHTDQITSVCFSPDGTTVVTASKDGCAKLWNAETGTLLADLKGLRDDKFSASFSPDGKKIVTSSPSAYSSKIWNAKTGMLLADIRVPKDFNIGYLGFYSDFFNVIFSPDGSKVLTESFFSFPKIWDVKTGALFIDFKNKKDTIFFSAFSADGGKFVTAKHCYKKKKAENPIDSNSLSLSLVVMNNDSFYADSVKIWDVRTGRLLNSGIFNMRYSSVSDKTYVISDSQLNALIKKSSDSTPEPGDHLIDTLMNKFRKKYGDQLHYTSDFKNIIITSKDSTAVYDIRTLSLLGKLNGYPGESLFLSPDRKKAVGFNFSRLIMHAGLDTMDVATLWDLRTGLASSKITGFFFNGGSPSEDDNGVISSSSSEGIPGEIFSFSPDSKKIAIASGWQAKIWDLSNGKSITELKSRDLGIHVPAREAKLMLPTGHTGKINIVSFSPDGKKFVSASDDHTAKIWDGETGIMLAELCGHTKKLTDASFSPDNKKILTASDDGTVKVWDAETGMLLHDLKGSTVSIRNASFSLDGKTIETYSEYLPGGCFYTCWDAQTGVMLNKPRLSQNTIAIAQLHASDPVGYASYPALSPDEKLRKIGTQLFDAKTDSLINPNIGGAKEVYMSEFSPDGSKIMITSNNETAKICDAHIGKLLVDLKGNTQQAEFSFSADGKKVLTVNRDSTLIIWDTQMGAMLVRIFGKDFSASFSPDGRKILTTRLGSPAQIWDAATGTLMVNLKEYGIDNEYGRLNISFSFDGKKIIKFLNGTVKIWDAQTGAPLPFINLKTDTTHHSPGAFYSLGAFFTPDKKKIVTLGEKTLEVWDVQTGLLLVDINMLSGKLNNASFSPNGKKIIVCGENGVKNWDTETWTPIANNKTDGKSGYNNSNVSNTSPDGRKLLHFSNASVMKAPDSTNMSQYLFDYISVYTFTSTVEIIDEQKNSLLLNLNEDNNWVENASFSPDGKKIVIASIAIDSMFKRESRGDNGKVREDYFFKKTAIKILDAQTGALIANLKGDTCRLKFASLSPDSKKIVAVFRNDTIKIIDAQTGLFQAILKGDTSDVNTVSFSPDSKKIVTSHANNSARLWDVQTGTLLAELKGHSGNVNNASFSPDGKNVLTSSDDNTCKIWSAATGELLFTFLAIDSNDYLITDPYGHYDGSAGARKLLYLTCGTEVINSKTIKEQLWVPNLAEHIMKGEKINAKKLSELDICGVKAKVEKK